MYSKQKDKREREREKLEIESGKIYLEFFAPSTPPISHSSVKDYLSTLSSEFLEFTLSNFGFRLLRRLNQYQFNTIHSFRALHLGLQFRDFLGLQRREQKVQFTETTFDGRWCGRGTGDSEVVVRSNECSDCFLRLLDILLCGIFGFLCCFTIRLLDSHSHQPSRFNREKGGEREREREKSLPCLWRPFQLDPSSLVPPSLSVPSLAQP